MAKTKRKKINGKGPLKSRNIKLIVARPGTQVRLAGGARKDDQPVKANPKATPVFLGRHYTGVNRGKVYPYASKKRSGDPSFVPFALAGRRTVGVVDGSRAT